METVNDPECREMMEQPTVRWYTDALCHIFLYPILSNPFVTPCIDTTTPAAQGQAAFTDWVPLCLQDWLRVLKNTTQSGNKWIR